MKSVAVAGLVIGLMVWSACDPYRETRPITVVAKPPLIEHQFCLALQDARKKPQEEVVVTGVAIQGSPDIFRATCDGTEHELLLSLAPGDDDLGMKAFRKLWNKTKRERSADCISCRRYEIKAKFVGTVMRDPQDPTKIRFEIHSADDWRRKRIPDAKP